MTLVFFSLVFLKFCYQQTRQSVILETCSVHSQIAEHIMHGNPSGIDTAVSCYGGVVALRPRNQLPLEPISVPIEMQALIVDTGVA